MAVSKAQQKAVTKYVKAKYDRFGLTMAKGHLDEIKAHAEAQSESVNGFINRAIDQTMGQDRNKAPSEGVQALPETVVSLSPPALQTAQEAAQSVGETVSQFIERAVSVQAQRDRSSLAMGINPTTGGKQEKEA